VVKVTGLIKEVPVVKVATIRAKDLEQISHCSGLRFAPGGEVFQQDPDQERRDLTVLGWFKGARGDVHILVQRDDDGRLFAQGLPYERGKAVQDKYPQLFVR